MFIVIVSFLFTFASLLVAVSMGMKYLERRKKQQVVAALKDAPQGRKAEQDADLLIKSDSVDAIQALFARFNIAKGLHKQILQAGLTYGVTGLVMRTAMGAAIGAALGLLARAATGQEIGYLFTGAVGACVPYLTMVRKRSKRMAQFEEQFPEALDFLARSMRAGHGFSTALDMLAQETPDPVGIEFRSVFNEHNLGAQLDTALHNLAERVPLLDVQIFASSVLMQRETGGNLSEILTRLAHVMRERFRLRGHVKAASAHGRMTARILSAMPMVTAVALMMIAPGYLQGMARDADGQKLILASLVAQGLGYVFIQRIIHIKI